MTAEQVNSADLRLLVGEFTMGEPDTAVAICAGIDGLFVGATAMPAVSGFSGLAPTPARLVGCRPEQRLQAALDALTRGAGAAGGALWRRRVSASVYSVAEDGTTVRVPGSGLHASVTAASPSPLAEGLLDVTFDAAVTDPMPLGASPIWELWRVGRPSKARPLGRL